MDTRRTTNLLNKSLILNEGREVRRKEGEEGCNEKAAAAAAALVTQLATALVCSALPCRGKLGSLAQLHLL